MSSEAVPQLPLIWVHAVVVTDTVDPEVLTEMPAAAAGGARERASAAAAAAVGPVRIRGFAKRMSTAFRRHGWRYIPCAAEDRGNARAATGPANAQPATDALRLPPGR
ncbi:hypothetical protein GCM10009601_17780 [Streptomyces thermospinosisporus]|uniref:Uncharacterized protein n=1 Tax=Streptomyces thermospinosisporus TaxID=161482 RepID=A0ABN1YQC5_9ACTN